MTLYDLSKRVFFLATRYLGVTRVLQSVLRRRLLVLCYHSVIDVPNRGDQYHSAKVVPLCQFREQMTWLRERYNPVSASQVERWVYDNQSLPERAVFVTFDDGLRNVLTVAAPELDRLKIPAAVFVATGYIGTSRLLWTDEITERIVNWRWPSVPMPGVRRDVPLPVSLGARSELARRTVALCKSLPNRECEAYLARLHQEPVSLDEDRLAKLYRFMSWEDLRTLLRLGWTVGSHTLEHPILSRIDPRRLNVELRESKAVLEHELRCPCTCLAYPNGGRAGVTKEVTSAAREVGYRLGFVLNERLNAKVSDPLAIDRISIGGGLPLCVFQARIAGLVNASSALPA